jgi:hypothetical protein
MANAISIDISDVLRFAADANVAADMLATELQETAYRAGVMVYQKSLDYVPVDTGTLKSSIGPVAVSGGATDVTAIVPVGAEYGIYVEKGTRYMRGRFYMGRALQDRLPDIETVFRDMGDRLMRRMGGTS